MLFILFSSLWQPYLSSHLLHLLRSCFWSFELLYLGDHLISILYLYFTPCVWSPYMCREKRIDSLYLCLSYEVPERQRSSQQVSPVSGWWSSKKGTIVGLGINKRQWSSCSCQLARPLPPVGSVAIRRDLPMLLHVCGLFVEIDFYPMFVAVFIYWNPEWNKPLIYLQKVFCT